MHTKPALNFVPVTFGALNNDKTLSTGGAWGYPEAGKQLNNNYHDGGWKSMANGKGSYQYDIYLRALKADASSTGDASAGVPAGFSLSAQDVYLSSMTLQDASHANPDDGSFIADALRVHLNVEGTDGLKELISRTAITSTAPLALSGYMDLDGDKEDDKYFVPSSDATKYGQKCLYGVEDQVQVTKGISDIVNPRNADGTITPDSTKLICTTKTGTTPSMKKITITVWIEGWALLRNDSTDATKKGNVWNPNMSAGMQLNVDMVFDVGHNIIG